MDPKPKKLLLTWLTLAVMLVALAGCVEKLPPENLDAPLPEATAPLTTDFVPKRVPVERLKGNLYDVYHMDDTRVLLAAEGIYIFDLATGQFLAKNETIIPEAARVSFQILDDTIARFGLNYELMNGEDQVISRTHAAIYDASSICSTSSIHRTSTTVPKSLRRGLHGLSPAGVPLLLRRHGRAARIATDEADSVVLPTDGSGARHPRARRGPRAVRPPRLGL